MIVQFSRLYADAALVAHLYGVCGLVVRLHLSARHLGGAVTTAGEVAHAVQGVRAVVGQRDVALAEKEKRELQSWRKRRR